MKVCPVCESQFDEKGAAADKRMVHYYGGIYYLMCRQCKAAFMRNPDQYAEQEHMSTGRTPAERNPPDGGDHGPQHNDYEATITG